MKLKKNKVLAFRKDFALEKWLFVRPSARQWEDAVWPSYGETRRYGIGTAFYIPVFKNL
jgi:hypothetical protein